MLLKTDTKNIQEKLANYTRNGELIDLQGTRKDRLHHYRRLTFNIQLQTMEQAFPIAYSIFEFDDWKSIVHSFFMNHDAQTPQIWKLPFEFYQFVKDNKYSTKFNFPFLNDLLLFEWVEIEVHTMQDEQQPEFVSSGNILNDIIVINPEYRLNKLEYPVHKVKPQEITSELKGDYFLLTYREKESGTVHFMDLSVLHTFAFEKIVIERKTISIIIDEATTLFGTENKDFIYKSIREFVELLFKKEIALGYQK